MKKKILLTTLIGFMCLTFCGAKSKELTLDNIPYDWPKKSALAEELPLPDAERTIVNSDYDDKIEIKVFGTQDDFLEYAEECKKAGYTIDVYEDGEENFWGSRKDGAYISLYYTTDDMFAEEGDKGKTIYYIGLRESWIKDDLDWPVTDLSLKLPKPEGTKGKSLGYNEKYFSIHVGEMPEEKVLEYIDVLKESGFSKDAMLLDGNFTAKYEEDENLELKLRYGGVDEMTITLQDMSD